MPAQLDATRFEELAKRGSDQLVSGDDAAASTTLRQALGLWRGEAFGEFREVEACAAEARRLEELRLALLEDRVDADLAAGQSAELVGEIEALLRDEPFRERLWGQLILALYRSGRQRDALEAYQRARRLLADELGIEPGPDLRRLEAAVLAQDPSLDVLRPCRLPVPGLPAALMAVGPAFVGREADLAWLREAWADAVDGRGGFVSVLGPEGIGKTRLVAELAREVHDDGAAVLYGRCDHAHRGARALLGQALQSAGSSWTRRRRAGEAGDIAEAVARHLPTWSQGRPVLVVLDDLHLADAETLEVVADLAGWCRATPDARGRRVPQRRPPTGDRGTARWRRVAARPRPHCRATRSGASAELYATEPWSAEDVEPDLRADRRRSAPGPRAGQRVGPEPASAGRRRRPHGRGSRRRLVASRGEIADGVEGIQRLLEQRRAQLAGREAQLQAVAVAALGGCPYKGLARFEAADAANFFGRERPRRRTGRPAGRVAVARRRRPSGSGKSSLVRAGLLPALAAGVLPGGRAVALGRPLPGGPPRPGSWPARSRQRARPAGGRWPCSSTSSRRRSPPAPADEQDEFIGRLLDLATARHGGGARHPCRPSRSLRHPRRAGRPAGRQRRPGRAHARQRAAAHRRAPGPAGRARDRGRPRRGDRGRRRRSGRALPLLSTALAETWERRRPAPHPRRLPGRGWRQRRARPHGRGRLRRVAAGPARPRAPAVAPAVRRRRRR